MRDITRDVTTTYATARRTHNATRLAVGQVVYTNVYHGLNWCSKWCATAVAYLGFCERGWVPKVRGLRHCGGWCASPIKKIVQNGPFVVQKFFAFRKKWVGASPSAPLQIHQCTTGCERLYVHRMCCVVVLRGRRTMPTCSTTLQCITVTGPGP